MNGCQFEQKSFSVPMSSKKRVQKCLCGNDAGVYILNGQPACYKCFSKNGKGIGLFSTHKDLAYNFTTDMFNGKPIEIRSRGQFKAKLKEFGMADASIKECHQEADFHKKLNAEEAIHKRKKTAVEIFKKMREKGQIGRK